MTIIRLILACVLISTLAAANINANPVPLDMQPVAIYEDVPGTFGLAYDSANATLWTSLNDNGDGKLHTLKPYHSFTTAELAAMPTINGVKRINPTVGQFSALGTTTVPGGTEYKSLAYDQSISQLVMQGVGPTLVSFDPFTADDINYNYSPFSAWEGFSDGLDVTDSNVWYSGDTLDIFKNGNFFAMRFNPAQTEPAGWLGSDDTKPGFNGWAGIQQVGNQLWTVAVISAGDAVGTRTLAGYDVNTGQLLWFDPDGDVNAIHFADMAFDGQYVYIADLHGDINNAGPTGDIYVYQIPEPACALLFTIPTLIYVYRRK